MGCDLRIVKIIDDKTSLADRFSLINEEEIKGAVAVHSMFEDMYSCDNDAMNIQILDYEFVKNNFMDYLIVYYIV